MLGNGDGMNVEMCFETVGMIGCTLQHSEVLGADTAIHRGMHCDDVTSLDL